MASKRKRVVLTLADKIKIIEQSDKGVSSIQLAKAYGVGTSTISDIKKSKPALLKYVSQFEVEEDCLSRKSMKTTTYKDLEDAVFKWFLQQRSMGIPISGSVFCLKAKVLAHKLGCSTFKASHGWLRNFKSRHGIRESDFNVEKVSVDLKAAENFIKQFSVIEDSYDPDFLYNADETGIGWKALPESMLVSKRKNSALEYEFSKERVTVLACANSTGNHKISLLMIGKSKNLEVFKNVKFPIFYKNQTRAFMTAGLFTQWYDDIFIPEVKVYQKSIGKEGSKVLLFIDDAPTHPSEELLIRENGLFKVIFLPPNTDLQPMNQSVIKTMKRYYRKQLLTKLLVECKDEESVLVNYKTINLKDCAYMLAEAWNLINIATLRHSWNKLKGVSIKEDNKIKKEKDAKDKKGVDEDGTSIQELSNIILKIPGCSEVNVKDVEEWVMCDLLDQGYQILFDDEVVKIEESDDEEDNLNIENEGTIPSASEAFTALETALKWMEHQPECDQLHLLTVKRLCDFAAQKQMNGFSKQ